jgi:hypothetical protein
MARSKNVGSRIRHRTVKILPSYWPLGTRMQNDVFLIRRRNRMHVESSICRRIHRPDIGTIMKRYNRIRSMYADVIDTYERYQNQLYWHNNHPLQYFPPTKYRSEAFIICVRCGAILGVLGVSISAYESTFLRLVNSKDSVEGTPNTLPPINQTAKHYLDRECTASGVDPTVVHSPYQIKKGISLYTGSIVSRPSRAVYLFFFRRLYTGLEKNSPFPLSSFTD